MLRPLGHSSRCIISSAPRTLCARRRRPSSPLCPPSRRGSRRNRRRHTARQETRGRNRARASAAGRHGAWRKDGRGRDSIVRGGRRRSRTPATGRGDRSPGVSFRQRAGGPLPRHSRSSRLSRSSSRSTRFTFAPSLSSPGLTGRSSNRRRPGVLDARLLGHDSGYAPSLPRCVSASGVCSTFHPSRRAFGPPQDEDPPEGVARRKAQSYGSRSRRRPRGRLSARHMRSRCDLPSPAEADFAKAGAIAHAYLR